MRAQSAHDPLYLASSLPLGGTHRHFLPAPQTHASLCAGNGRRKILVPCTDDVELLLINPCIPKRFAF